MSVPSGWWPQARKGELVAYLDDAEYARLLACTEVAEAGAGDFLLHKGSPSRSILLVEQGEVVIVDDAMGEGVVLGRAGAGEVVGEVGFLDGRPRTHDVRAGTPCRVRRLTREGLLSLAQSDPHLFAKVCIALAELVARRFRGALADLEPVRAFAASLCEPDTTLVDDPDRPSSADVPPPRVTVRAGPAAGEGPPDGGFQYDPIDDPLLDQALDVLRELGRRPSKDLAGV
ncbi:MAG TPA: cyclic nucleotide-binding domain-containing protein [Vicinamibacteria bacterium]|nr:cyclic nucleotide-binding domain-containing protein [Vicinamibacteria bacterium]